MGEYDLKRLEVAIQYINRMVSGRNPVTNRPAPENEVLTNANVNRCLQFVSEILTDVKSTGGIVGKAPKTPRAPRAPKPSIAETFPYEILQGFQFQQDQQISYFLKQLAALLPEDASLGVQTTMITDWLRENGYMEKCFMKDISKETTIPTKKGEEIGIYSERAGLFPNEYYRIFYNEQAQRFLIENFRRILTEGGIIRERLKKERREKKKQEKAANAGFDDDPAFLSLLNSVPADISYDDGPQEYPYDLPRSYGAPEGSHDGRSYNDRNAAGGFNADGFQQGALDGFFEDGWENADENLPW